MPADAPITGISLRRYQQEALAAIDAAALRGLRRLLLVLPTGTGKTLVFAELIRRRAGRALVLAHRDELISQAVDKIHLVHPPAQIGVVKAERDECDAPVVVASVQTLTRPARLQRLRSDFSTVIVDEAHHGTADSYVHILEHIGAFTADGPLTLGVTATPERADGTPLGEVWEDIVYRADLLPMIEQGYLADLRAIQVRLDTNLDRVHTRGGDLVASELEHELRAANAPAHVLGAYRMHAGDRKAIVFTPTVALAHEMANVFSDAGILAEAVTGETDDDLRRDVLARFHTGETRIVANCAVLTEGFDEPSVDCIVIARPTKSRPLYTQMIGRGTRIHPGKRDCLILDLVGSTTRHELQTAATLFGLTPRELTDSTIAEATERRRVAAAQEAAHGRLVAQTVDLFHRRSLHWISTGASQHALSIGDGLLMLTTDDLSHWRVEHVDRNRQRRILAEGLDLGFAQGTAEDYARRIGAGVLVDRQAAWRRAPASAGQLEALRRCRIPVRPGLTKGEASDLITAAAARRCA